MASYSVRIKTSAAKELEAVDPRSIRVRIVSRIQALARSPRPSGCQKLAGEAERYRLRQGSYRIVYAVDDEQRVVEVVKIGHRREVYR
ncbi:MAG: type II toxin-antitoxin system RelE/ParE family toxin [Proteobacteria bacterium]|nr:type II toxin-antitoxin system RelE/ParE family toxin [Pseudomonadota bacterium]